MSNNENKNSKDNDKLLGNKRSARIQTQEKHDLNINTIAQDKNYTNFRSLSTKQRNEVKAKTIDTFGLGKDYDTLSENDQFSDFLEKEVNKPKSKPLKFTIKREYKNCRASVLDLPHGKVNTPIFMPVGTKAAMKGLLSVDLDRMKCNLCLANTYHLTLQPGDDFIKKGYKNVHNLMKWKKNVLTDSGGFQMVSLDSNTTVTEEGVEFTSHIKGDDRRLMLTPEKSIEIQNNLGSDIIMMLDDVLRPNSTPERLKEACQRTIRWLDRCIAAHKNPDSQNLFPIVQGGLDLDLRKWCIEEMIKRNQPGYAIGGLAGGETKDDFWKVVSISCQYLPKDKPRYLMGVGYPIDCVVCSFLGVDMFDCVFPTRTARFGTAFTNKGFIKLKKETMKYDFNPIESDCDCEVCKNYSRSYFYMMMTRNPRSAALVSFHNVYYLLNLMGKVRKAISDGKVQDFADRFFIDQFSELSNEEFEKNKWVLDALDSAGIQTKEIAASVAHKLLK